MFSSPSLSRLKWTVVEVCIALLSERSGHWDGEGGRERETEEERQEKEGIQR